MPVEIFHLQVDCAVYLTKLEFYQNYIFRRKEMLLNLLESSNPMFMIEQRDRIDFNHPKLNYSEIQFDKSKYSLNMIDVLAVCLCPACHNSLTVRKPHTNLLSIFFIYPHYTGHFMFYFPFLVFIFLM